MGIEELTLKNKNLAYGLAALIGTGGFYTGYYMSIFNPIGSYLFENHYKMNEDKKNASLGNINLFFPIGAAISVLAFGPLSNKLGRVRTLLLAELVALLAYLFYSSASLKLLYTARFLGGMTGGINVAGASVVLSEFFPRSISGAGGIFVYTNITFSILLSLGLQRLLGTSYMGENWRFFIVWPVLLSVIRISLFVFVYRVESPKFFLNQEKMPKQTQKEKIFDSLRFFYSSEESEIEAGKMVSNSENEFGRREATFKELFNLRYRFRTIGGSILNIIQQLSGINFLIFFSTDFFNEVSGNGETISFLMGLSNFFGSIIGLFALSKFGRRFNLLFGTLVQFLAFSVLSICIYTGNKFFPALAVIFYMTGFAMGLGGTIIPYTADILPSVGVGLANCIQWVMAALIGKFTPLLNEQ